VKEGKKIVKKRVRRKMDKRNLLLAQMNKKGEEGNYKLKLGDKQKKKKKKKNLLSVLLKISVINVVFFFFSSMVLVLLCFRWTYPSDRLSSDSPDDAAFLFLERSQWLRTSN
jgi:uncharacterized protein YqhQ